MNRIQKPAALRRTLPLLTALLLGLTAATGTAAAAGFEDDFADAGAFGGKAWYQGAPGGTASATKEPGEPAHAGFPGGASVWISWTPSQTQTAEIWTCSGMDALLGVYTGSAINLLTPVASNDESGLAHGCAAPNAGVRFTAVAATKYMIAVDAKSTRKAFNLSIRTEPLNDDFADAEPLTGSLPLGTSVDNRIATKEEGEPNHAGHVRGNTVWYEWVAPYAGEFGADTCTGENSDTALAVYAGTAVGALTEVAANDDAEGLCHESSEVAFEAVEGVTYMIALDGSPKYASLYLGLYALSPPPEEGEKGGEGESSPLLDPAPEAAIASFAAPPVTLPGSPPAIHPRRPECRKAARKGKAHRAGKARAARKARCNRG